MTTTDHELHVVVSDHTVWTHWSSAVELGYEIEHVFEVWHFEQSQVGLFESYVNTWLNCSVFSLTGLSFLQKSLP